MRAVVVEAHGGPDKLRLVSAPDLACGPDDLIVEVAAAGVNFADVMGRQGSYPDAPAPPFVPGYEVAGVVGAVGARVRGFRPGDRVATLTRFGGYATQVRAQADTAWPIPDGVSFPTAAAVPVVYLTAYLVLETLGRCRSGETILVDNAAGGLGLALIALAQLMDLQVVALCSSAKRRPLREATGVDAFDPAEPDLVERIRSAAPGGRVDLVVSSAGARFWSRALDLLAPGGRLAIVGIRPAANTRWARLSVLRDVVAMPWHRIHPLALMQANTAVFGINVLRLLDTRPELVLRAWRQLGALWHAGKLRPIVDSVHPLADAGAAQERLSTRSNFGKVVLDAGGCADAV